jgi:hypothetical protein
MNSKHCYTLVLHYEISRLRNMLFGLYLRSCPWLLILFLNCSTNLLPVLSVREVLDLFIGFRRISGLRNCHKTYAALVMRNEML